MRKIFQFYTILLLSSCSLLDTQRFAPNYFDAYEAVKGYIYGYEDYPITRELVDSIPYSSLKLKIGKGSAGLLILEELDENHETFISADRVRIVLKEGKIIKTSGLSNNLLRREEPKSTFKTLIESGVKSSEYYYYYYYDEPKVNGLKLKATLQNLGEETIDILGNKLSVIKIEERLENAYLGWEVLNFYWIDKQDYYVWKSIQTISPIMPQIKYEVTKKPSR